jgi:uncharacterized integral membrane protein
MADPHHVEPLTPFDRWTVALYRSGIALAAVGVGALAAANGLGWDQAVPRWVVLLGVALIVANLHLYDRRIRWFIGASGWVGAVLIGAGGWAPAAVAPWLRDAGLGFAFVVLSATALKERFCFKLPVVVLVPPVLATSLLPLRLAAGGPAAALLAVGAAVLALLAISKVSMPSHYDIGDKSRYQV